MSVTGEPGGCRYALPGHGDAHCPVEPVSPYELAKTRTCFRLAAGQLLRSGRAHGSTRSGNLDVVGSLRDALAGGAPASPILSAATLARPDTGVGATRGRGRDRA